MIKSRKMKTVLNFGIPYRMEFLDHLNDCQVLKEILYCGISLLATSVQNTGGKAHSIDYE
jgi:hypothetical protein